MENGAVFFRVLLFQGVAGSTMWSFSPNNLNSNGNANVFNLNASGNFNNNWTTSSGGVAPAIG